MTLTKTDSPLPDVLSGNWTRETLFDLACEMGVIRRARKKEIWVLVWVLVFGMSSGSRRTLTGLMESYNQYAQSPVSSSSFQGWFSAALAAMLKRMLLDAFRQSNPAWRIPGHLLDGFIELLAIDSTVVNLHRLLRKYYPSTQKTGAAAKLHVVINVFDASIRRLKLTGQRTGDGTPWKRLGDWVRGRLLLFDLGYYNFNLFSRIEANGGFFISRVKSNANPRIVENLRSCPGQCIDVVGQKLQDILPRLQRDVLDVIVEVQVKNRRYKGKQNTVTRRFRLVGLRRKDGSYFLYFTNLSVEDIPADDLAAIYALRWQIELLFASLKGQNRLDELPSQKKEVVEILIWSSLLSDLCSRRLYRWIRDQIPADRHLPPRRFAKVVERVREQLLAEVLAPQPTPSRSLITRLLRAAPDPNRNRSDRSLQAIPLPRSPAEVIPIRQSPSKQKKRMKAVA